MLGITYGFLLNFIRKVAWDQLKMFSFHCSLAQAAKLTMKYDTFYYLSSNLLYSFTEILLDMAAIECKITTMIYNLEKKLDMVLFYFLFTIQLFFVTLKLDFKVTKKSCFLSIYVCKVLNLNFTILIWLLLIFKIF